MGWAEGLQGAGAWFAGQGPQYEAAKALESRTAAEDERQRRLDKLAGNKLRVDALVQDFTQVKSLKDQGRTDLAIELLNNRIPLIDQDPDGDSTDSRELLAALQDPARQEEADVELTAFLTRAGVLEPQPTGEKYLKTVNGQAVYQRPDGSVYAKPVEGYQAPPVAPFDTNTSVTLNMRMWDQLNPGATQEQRQNAFAELARASKMVDGGGGQVGMINPLTGRPYNIVVTAEDATTRDAAAEGSKAAATAEATAQVKNKQNLLRGQKQYNALDVALTNYERALAKTATIPFGDKLALTAAQQEAQLAKAQVGASLKGVTRETGEGVFAKDDREAMMLELPGIGTYDSARRQGFDTLRSRAKAGAGLPQDYQPDSGADNEDAQAIAWAKANPNDPRAAAVLQQAGVR